jgi:uncharacterized membrane protein YjdF
MDQLIAIKNLKKRIFIRAALATIGTFVLNTIGIWLSLYSVIWWYDMPLHFFGGLFTGLLVIWFLMRYSKFTKASYLETVFWVLFISFIIGFVWEFYEIFFYKIGGQNYVIMDAISDIFFDLAGAIQALFIYFRHKNLVIHN